MRARMLLRPYVDRSTRVAATEFRNFLDEMVKSASFSMFGGSEPCHSGLCRVQVAVQAGKCDANLRMFEPEPSFIAAPTQDFETRNACGSKSMGKDWTKMGIRGAWLQLTRCGAGCLGSTSGSELDN